MADLVSDLRPFEQRMFAHLYARRCRKLILRRKFQQRRVLVLALIFALGTYFGSANQRIDLFGGLIIGLIAGAIANLLIHEVFVKLPAWRHAKKMLQQQRHRQRWQPQLSQ